MSKKVFFIKLLCGVLLFSGAEVLVGLNISYAYAKTLQSALLSSQIIFAIVPLVACEGIFIWKMVRTK